MANSCAAEEVKPKRLAVRAEANWGRMKGLKVGKAGVEQSCEAKKVEACFRQEGPAQVMRQTGSALLLRPLLQYILLGAGKASSTSSGTMPPLLVLWWAVKATIPGVRGALPERGTVPATGVPGTIRRHHCH